MTVAREEEEDCSAAKAQTLLPFPQDICFFRNTQKTTFMSARWSQAGHERERERDGTISHVDIDF